MTSPDVGKQTDIGQRSARLTSPPGGRLSASQRMFLQLCVAVHSSMGMKMYFPFGITLLFIVDLRISCIQDRLGHMTSPFLLVSRQT